MKKEAFIIFFVVAASIFIGVMFAITITNSSPHRDISVISYDPPEPKPRSRKTQIKPIVSVEMPKQLTVKEIREKSLTYTEHKDYSIIRAAFDNSSYSHDIFQAYNVLPNGSALERKLFLEKDEAQKYISRLEKVKKYYLNNIFSVDIPNIKGENYNIHSKTLPIEIGSPSPCAGKNVCIYQELIFKNLIATQGSSGKYNLSSPENQALILENALRQRQLSCRLYFEFTGRNEKTLPEGLPAYFTRYKPSAKAVLIEFLIEGTVVYGMRP